MTSDNCVGNGISTVIIVMKFPDLSSKLIPFRHPDLVVASRKIYRLSASSSTDSFSFVFITLFVRNVVLQPGLSIMILFTNFFPVIKFVDNKYISSNQW